MSTIIFAPVTQKRMNSHQGSGILLLDRVNRLMNLVRGYRVGPREVFDIVRISS